MKRDRGFVLISVLLTVMLMMLLTLSQWQSLLLFQRALGRFQVQEDRLKQLEQVAFQIWKRYQTGLEEECTHIYCKQGDIQYKFDLMGIYPCIQYIEQGVPHSTVHHQLTLKQAVSGAVLIIRFADILPALPCPSKKYRYVASQVLSWRYWSSGMG